jgi:hypothetical protein
LITDEEYAPASPRSLVTMRIAARLDSVFSTVRGWETLEYVATADTARVSSRAYGADAWARCCAFTIRDAAISSIARVIFLIVVTEDLRCLS